MANIMITEACNFKCTYCFANEFVNQTKDCEMSLDTFRTILHFLAKTPGEHIGIIGGEPTLHSQFPVFMEELIHYLDSVRGAGANVFTNGYDILKYKKYFIHRNVTALINYNGAMASSLEKEQHVTNALHTLYEEGFGSHFSIGINLFSPLMDLTYFIDTVKRLKPNAVRIAVTVPNSGETREMGALAWFKLMKPKVFELIESLAFLGVQCHWDCNSVPSCIWTAEEERKLLHIDKVLGTLPENSVLRRPLCHPVMDIRKDLSVVRCFGLSGVKRYSLLDYEDIHQLRHAFSIGVDGLAKNLILDNECKTCAERIRGICLGGCLGYKYDALEQLNKVVEDLNNVR